MFCAPVLTAEILRIILCLKDNKAPGSDNYIAPKRLKLIPTDVMEPLYRTLKPEKSFTE